jgi:hypothetical protein
MSRAILKMLLARTIKHEPTDTELTEFLCHCQELAGERLYIPQRQPMAGEVQRIKNLRADGWSIRKIAKEVRASKSQVHRALSQNSDLFVDNNP